MRALLLVIFLFSFFTSSSSLAAGVPNSQLAFRSPFVQINDDIMMMPASVQKLITATAAAHVLGPNFRFVTRLDVYKNDKGGLNARLALNGDPTLKMSDVLQMFESARDQGLSDFDVLELDVSSFNGHQRGGGQVWNDLGKCFASPISAFNLSEHCIRGNIKPGAIGQPAISSVSDPELLKLDSNVVTVKSTALCSLDLSVVGSNHFRLDGCLKNTVEQIPLSFSTNDPQSWFMSKLVRGFKHSQMSWPKKVDILNWPNKTQMGKAQWRFKHQSSSLKTLMPLVLRNSDNRIADSLFVQVGLHKKGVASFSTGTRAVNGIMEDLGLNASRLQLRDGSGLSRENLVSANFVFQLLQTIRDRKNLQWLIQTMPVSGESGTLRNRSSVKSEPLKGLVVAKTGYINGVRNLAGYLHVQRQWVPFVSLSNGAVLSAQESRAVRSRKIMHPHYQWEQQQLLELLAQIELQQVQ
ncbi:D-alanyl-D-alanine carboxypeptidase/D-alanyl-D-alanine-endopeptidase [Alginatibacterium sediminis]|uniref:D-alanyl-D-alanine carboxypeptidase/D-alanyl-D-alanine-endopeptidase n=1 Tax=Alginatibacterium sediminis TaxID=2164068 RepID=A0A420EI26_9ALTE|nr:D-alanyl-D-alanine carboxypeptidase/D-alanyl-D-alanine-endopeptidase [Alginatibacterium sediminis]RKF20206.1 D-alanyl-D-alanine carboxypeptidase/D-alanyl-D-alanine-endopeptidase [Alginatibacterium sediminis]